jgi:hypothetical protein
LELLPAWQLRGGGGDASSGRLGQGVDLMIVIPHLGAATTPLSRLWAQVQRALHGLGLPKEGLDQPLELAQTDQQLLAAELKARDPRWLVILGDEIADMVALAEPAQARPEQASSVQASPAQAGPQSFKTVGLDVLLREPLKKAQLWQDFCRLKQML